MIQTPDTSVDSAVAPDYLIDQILNLGNLLRRHRPEMGEVESEAVRGYEGSGLLDMDSQDSAQGGMHEVGRSVVSGRGFPPQEIQAGADGVSRLEFALLRADPGKAEPWAGV